MSSFRLENLWKHESMQSKGEQEKEWGTPLMLLHYSRIHSSCWTGILLSNGWVVSRSGEYKVVGIITNKCGHVYLGCGLRVYTRNYNYSLVTAEELEVEVGHRVLYIDCPPARSHGGVFRVSTGIRFDFPRPRLWLVMILPLGLNIKYQFSVGA